MYSTYVLENKASIHLVPLKDTKSLAVLVMFPVGSRYEEEKMQGVSHFVEHMMFKGTGKRPDTLTLTREIDRLGANYNAFTGKEYTGYYIKTDAKYSETVMDILSDMLFNSKFEEKEMEKEKGVVVEEIRMYRDNPLMNIENIFEDLMYTGSPLGLDIAGTEKHVLSYEHSDVVAYRDAYYTPGNMHVIVAGAIDEKVEEQIKEYFGSVSSDTAAKQSYVPFGFGPEEKDKRIFIEEKKTDQAQMMLGFPGLPYDHDDNLTVGVMNTILGGSMSSRLFIQIREKKGLAYMVKSGSDHFRDTGYAYVRAGLESKNINEAIAVIREEIGKIIAEGVTESELADAKTHIRGGLTLSLEDSSAQANWYASQILFHKKVENPEERLKKVEAVTNEDVKRLAKQIYDFEKMRVAIIGDVKKEDVQF
ncbi:MAG: pitrilysin family protein [Candidatus Magasanikbacteria bacterium]